VLAGVDKKIVNRDKGRVTRKIVLVDRANQGGDLHEVRPGADNKNPFFSHINPYLSQNRIILKDQMQKNQNP
jgi:hypothetical protein